MKLFKENKEQAGYYDILEWLNSNYPFDIFILENPEFLEIRDRARSLLIKHGQQTKPTTLNLVSIEHQSDKTDRSMDKDADTTQDKIKAEIDKDYNLCECGHLKELHKARGSNPMQCEGFDLTKPKEEQVNHLCKCTKFLKTNNSVTEVKKDGS